MRTIFPAFLFACLLLCLPVCLFTCLFFPTHLPAFPLSYLPALLLACLPTWTLSCLTVYCYPVNCFACVPGCLPPYLPVCLPANLPSSCSLALRADKSTDKRKTNERRGFHTEEEISNEPNARFYFSKYILSLLAIKSFNQMGEIDRQSLWAFSTVMIPYLT